MKEFKIVRKGYDRDAVDAYIAELENSLLAQAAQLKDYKGKDRAIADSIIEAQVYASQTRDAADAEADATRSAMAAEVDGLKARVAALQEKLSAFQEEYTRILQEYLVSIRSNELVDLFNDLEGFVGNLNKPAEEPADEESPVELEELL